MVTGTERNITLRPYPQEFSATLQESGSFTCAVADGDGRVWLGGAEGLLRCEGDAVRPCGPESGGPAGSVTALCRARGTVYAAAGKELFALQGERWQPAGAPGGEVQVLGGDDERVLAVAGGTLHIGDGRQWQAVPLPEPVEVRAAAGGPAGRVYLATAAGLWRWAGGEWRRFGRGEGHGGMKSEDARALFVDRYGHVWVGTAAGIELLDGGEWWEHITGKEGLCYEDVTCLAPLPSGRLWIGTTWGLVRLDGGQWSYFASRRWLPHDRVLAVAATEEAVYAVTPGGVGRIWTRMMTLEEKAAYFEERIQKRHYRLGYVSDAGLENPGDTEHFFYHASDNDGLWTGLYVAAEAYRYGATKDPAARRLAATSLQAMLELTRKCTLRGYVARALVRKDEPKTRKSGGEWHSTADGQYEWKGDTSSDEIDGHLYAYSIYFDLVADEEEKRQIAEVTELFMDYILDNGCLLIDVDGKVTRWGVWAPSHLNDDPDWEPERGLNSLEMLSHLRAAYHITGKARYLEAYRDLVSNHHYALNTLWQKILEVGNVNHSDDELAFCAYYPLLAYEDDPELRRLYLLSYERSWQIERPEHSAWFNYMYGALTGQLFDAEETVRMLRESPMETICWETRNSQRADLVQDPHAGRFGELQATTALRADERQMIRWNGNPYRLDDRGDGRREDEGTAFLLPYWMGRYYGFITEVEQA